MTDQSIPAYNSRQVLIKVHACGVCRTDLHVVDGELQSPKLPLVPGHEIVGSVVAAGAEVAGIAVGQRVGVPWLGSTCGHCYYCKRQQENLCDDAGFTGYDLDGGYAEFVVADSRYVFPVPEGISDVALAPMLCAGLIGYRSLRMTGDARSIGIYGFGAAAHIVTQIARFQGLEIFAFTRPGDNNARDFARSMGVVWAGSSTEPPPRQLDAAIIYAPVGDLVPVALGNIRKGGVVVCAGIHMSDIPAFPYHLLWGERSVRSVANLSRKDGEEFLQLLSTVPVHTSTETFPLSQANLALQSLRQGNLQGAAVLVPDN